jgi:15-cis-phytoene synthase
MKALYDSISIQCSRLITRSYSTSFSIGIRCLSKDIRDPVYSIYGFVRSADEIVDTFHGYNKQILLQRFKEDTYRAIEEKISMNLILNSFQATVHQFKIEHELIDLFLQSMEMDLYKRNYDPAEFKEYILGSSEVVGLMCLRVFCNGDDTLFNKLKPYAMSLGSAFQKVNFLRDLNADFSGMGRSYFPGIEIDQLNDKSKKLIEESIETDFHEGYKGIMQLPPSARFGVYVAYAYYLALFKKIRNTPADKILQSRIRICNRDKIGLLAYSFFKHQLNII